MDNDPSRKHSSVTRLILMAMGTRPAMTIYSRSMAHDRLS
jgi:hypothetical protein